MPIPEWKVTVLAAGVVVLLLHNVMWQWWWWRLDHTAGINDTCLPGNHKLISNDSSTFSCQPCRFCGAGMRLSPPCGSTLTRDTAVKCRPILTTVLRKTYLPTKRTKTTYLENVKGTNNVRTQNGNDFTWSPLDVSDVYKTKKLEDTNLSKMNDLNEHFGFLESSSRDVQSKTTTSPTKYSLPYTVRRWRQKYKRPYPKPLAPRSKTINNSGHFTAPHPSSPEQVNKRSSNTTWGSQIINITYVLGGFPWAALVLVMIVAIIALLLYAISLVWLLFSIISITWNKKSRGYHRLNSEEQVEEISDVTDTMDHRNAKNSSDASTSIVKLKKLLLSELPPDLEDLLVKKLDVRRNGERLFGWEKIGAAFKISKKDLEYLSIEYRRDNGSPTSKLLLILGTTKCKTVSDLINVLKSRKVKRPDVASLIRHYIKEANKSQ